MATDYLARQKAKKSRRNAETPKRVRTKKNQPRRLCRGFCYQSPDGPVEGSDGEDHSLAAAQNRSNPAGGELSKYANLTFDKKSVKQTKAAEKSGSIASVKVKEKRPKHADELKEIDTASVPRVKRAKLSTSVQLQRQAKKETSGIKGAVTKQPIEAASILESNSAAAAAALHAFPEEIRRYMDAEGHAALLPIQTQCCPALVAGRDISAVAPPGSGKTLAYLLPAAAMLLRTGHSKKTRPPGPLALVLLPTRELAQQVAGVCHRLDGRCGLRSVCLTGGVSKEQQIAALRRGPHIVIATPGRLVDLEEEGHVVLGDVSYVVLDEADKMLGLGFTSQIEKLKRLLLGLGPRSSSPSGGDTNTDSTRVDSNRPQVALFTATMPQEVRAVAQDWLRQPHYISMGTTLASLANRDGSGSAQADGNGNDGVVSSTVTQVVHVCAEHKKPAKLVKHLEAIKQSSQGMRHFPRVLIFSNRIKTVRFVAKLVERSGFRAAQLHGQRSQEERDEAVKDFRAGKIQILVASDVAARGLDIKNLPYVVNYDFPSSLDTYVHRVGRTGRLAADGHAFSFVTREMASLAPPLIAFLDAHGQSLDPNLVKLAEAYTVAVKKLELENGTSSVRRTKRPTNDEEAKGGTLHNSPQNNNHHSQAGTGGDVDGKSSRPQIQEVLHELNMKSKAEKKRERAAEARRGKKKADAEKPVGGGVAGGDGIEEYVPCRKFDGSKRGYVFKRGGLGVGYYLDRPLHVVAARLANGGGGAVTSKKPGGGGVPLLPGRMKHMRRKQGNGWSSGDSSDEDNEAQRKPKKAKQLPGRLRKKLANDRKKAVSK